MIGLGVLEIIEYKFIPPGIVAAAFEILQNRSAPLFGPVCDPVLKLIGDAGEIGSGDAGTIAVGIEDPPGLAPAAERVGSTRSTAAGQSSDTRTRCYSCDARKRRSWNL